MLKKAIKQKYLAFFMLLLSPLTLAQSHDDYLKTPGTLSVCSYTAFKPVIYGNGQGYEADLLKAVAKLTGLRIKFYPQSDYEKIWSLPSLATSACDIAAAGIMPSEGRAKDGKGVKFSVVTSYYEESLLVRKKDFNEGRIVSYRSFKDADMKIGVVPNTTGATDAYIRVKENGLSPKVIVTYNSEKELLAALDRGEIDAIARGNIGNEYQQRIDPKYTTIDKKNFNEKFAFAVDARNQKLLNELNDSLKKITNNGEITYSHWVLDNDVFMKRSLDIK
jgi:ABC-type amino acid transport substrate-binding protein